MLRGDNESCHLIEHGIEVRQVNIGSIAVGTIHLHIGQGEGSMVALLAGNEIVDGFHLGRVDEGALNAHGVLS